MARRVLPIPCNLFAKVFSDCTIFKQSVLRFNAEYFVSKYLIQFIEFCFWETWFFQRYYKMLRIVAFGDDVGLVIRICTHRLCTLFKMTQGFFNKIHLAIA